LRRICVPFPSNPRPSALSGLPRALTRAGSNSCRFFRFTLSPVLLCALCVLCG
jgi:hypothetical protein